MTAEIPWRIGLIGAECTGKSALATRLAGMLDAVVVTEQVRDFVREQGRPPGRHEQRGVMAAQQGAEDTAAREFARVIADPVPVLTAAYSIAYFDDPSLVEEGLERADDYAVVAWCRPDLPWVADEGQRDGPEWRDRVDRILGELIVPRLAERTLVVEAAGPLHGRAQAVRQAWQRLRDHRPT